MSMLDELLEAERAAEELPVEDVQRLRVGIQAAVRAGAALAATGAPSTGAPDGAQSVAEATSAVSQAASNIAPWLKALLLVALGAVGGSVLTYLVTHSSDTPPPVQAQDTPVSTNERATPLEPPREPVDPPVLPVLPEPVATPPTTMTSNERREPALRLADERALIDSARQALVRNEPDAALSTLRRHRRSYGRGALREERDALEVVALAQAGRPADAERLGRRFHTRYPTSLLGGTVRAAIAALPTREDGPEDRQESFDDE